MSRREVFGTNLRRMRLRRGVSLDDLSASTKVSIELWEAMECNDFSRWPTGIHARAYIREYAEAVGADPDATVDEFCRLFPQGDRRAERLVRGHAELVGHVLAWSDDLPPALAEGDRRASSREEAKVVRPWSEARHLRRFAAGLDLVAVVLLGWIGASVGRVDFWATVALTTLLYHGVSVAVLGCTLAAWAIETYASAHPQFRRPGDVPLFRRLVKMRKDDRSPRRGAAS